MALLSAYNLGKSFGTRLLFEGVRFEVEPHDRIGLVGVNGCGKSTLFRILQGAENADTGSVSISRDARIAGMEQNVSHVEATVYEGTLGVFSDLIETEAALSRIEDELALSPAPADMMQLLTKQQALRERFEAGGGLTYKSRTRATLLGLGFTPAELDKPLSSMSGGQRNKAQLARVLLSGANLLLLDEPTNHLDIDAIRYLEDYLSAWRGAFIVISHDRYFLDKVTNKTLEFKNGRLLCSPGNYSRHLALISSEQETLRRKFNNTQKEIRRIEGIVEQQRRFGRERNFITAASKLKQIERLKATLVAPEKEPEGIHFHFTARETGGNDVLICSGLAKSYEKPIFRNVDLHIRKGERVFLLGANGCGKTTLLRILMDLEYPDAGEVQFGAHVHPAYYEQHMTSLHAENTVLSEVWNAYPKLDQTKARSALAAFLFRGDDVEKSIGMLSGGEQARVQLLKMMLSEANFLLLDEPTNHLDIASREALEDALEGHEGTMLIVTHDRYLVNRLADRVLFLTPDGIREFIGGYDDYLAALAQEEEAREAPRQERASDYKLQKQRQNERNLAKGELARAEERIAEAEAAYAALQAELACAASDYQKAQTLSQKAEKQRLAIEGLYARWEEAQAKLDALSEDPA